MKTILKSAVSVLFALAVVIAGEHASFANEPTNNTFPGGSPDWYGTPYMFECSTSGCGFGGGSFGGYPLEISSSSDIDYFVVVCGAHKTISSVSININTSADLDLQVYKLDGSLVGGSYGTTNYESVTTSSATMNALVAKIYGYGGAQSGYQLNFACTN